MNITVVVPDRKVNDWEVSTFEVTEAGANLHNLRASFHPGARIIYPGTYKKLTRRGAIVMSNTPAEIRDHAGFINIARRKKSILINGLGLGVALAAILESDSVTDVTVIEKSADVITLVAPTFSDDKRVTIVCADAFEWQPPKGKRYNVVWHDIWDNICADNLPEMVRLHRKYGRRTDWQGSWCKELCRRYLTNREK